MLDGGSRDLLVRASVLRRPGSRDLLMALAGEGEAAAIETLRTTGLLTEIREPKSGGGWAFSYEVHPLVGRLAAQRSDRADALREEGHRRAGAHLEQLAQTSPSWQDNVEAAYHLRQLGEADRAYDLLAPLVQWLLERGRVLDARAVLADIGDPGSLHPSRAAWVRTFAGDAAIAYGDLAAALAAYRASLAIAERLAAADPSNAAWQRDLSVSHNRLGDVLVAQGQLDDALAAYRAGLAIAERLAAADPSNAAWQRDLSVSHNRLGDVLVAQGQLEDALAAYRAGLAIAERLAAADPSNAAWQRDLSVSHDRIGDVLVAQGQLDDALAAYRAGLAIAERLAAADPSNAAWQRDLSVSHDRIGDVLRAQGQLGDALAAYRPAWPSPSGWRRPIRATPLGSATSRSATTRSATCWWRRGSWPRRSPPTAPARDPRAAGGGRSEQRRLAARPVGQPREARRRAGRAGAAGDALAAYQASLAIFERLAAADPSNAQWQYDLVSATSAWALCLPLKES